MQTSVHIEARRPCPGLENVLGGVNVPILNIPTVGAQMSPDRKRLLNNLFTLETPLRSKTRRHFHNPATGAFSLETEDILECGPTRVGNRLSEMMVLEHIGHAQVFNGDEGVTINVRPGRLVRVVLTLAGDLEMLAGRLLGRFAAAVGTLRAPRRLALQPAKLLRATFETARVLDGVPVRVGDEVSESDIKAHSITFALCGRVSEVRDDKHVPMTVGSQHEMSSLGSTFERAVLLDLEAAAELLGDSQASGIGIEVHVAPRPVLPKLYRMPAVSRLETWEADLASEFFTVKETLEGFAEAIGESLHDGLGDMLGTGATPASLEAKVDVVIGEKLTRLIVISFDHFQHLVVKMATFYQTRKELNALNATRIEPVLKRFIHNPIIADIGTLCTDIHQLAKADGSLVVCL